jgi:hypothetical protein
VHPDSDQIKLLEVLFNISKLLEQKWNAKPGAFYYSIVLPENEDVRFLKATHSSHECDIKLGAFSLGNVFEHRQFNEHLEVLEMGGEIERLKKNFMEEKYKRKDWDRAFDLYPTTSNLPMSVEFEHDRQRLAVKFLNPTTNELGQPVIDHVKLVIQYAAIKQIYWQMTNAQNGRAAISHRLYFRILHPPTVLKIGDFFNMGDKPKQDNRGKGNGNTKSAAVQSEERCYSWTNKGNDNKAVRDSPILMLNFEIENYSLNTFMLNLLGRLQSIIKIPVEIRNFKTEEAPILPEM